LGWAGVVLCDVMVMVMVMVMMVIIMMLLGFRVTSNVQVCCCAMAAAGE